MTGGARRSGGWELAGVPVQYLHGHIWIPLAAAADGALALATGESGAMFLRRVGRGSLLLVPTGPISRRYDAVATLSRRFNHDEIWLRAWDQVLYSLVPNESAPGALPVLANLQPGASQALPAREYLLPMKIINRGHAGPLVMATHVTAPSGRVVYTRVEPLDLAPGRDKVAVVRVPVPADWGEGLYPVYLTLSDPKARRLLHQAMELIPVAGTVALTLKSEKRGYRLGEEARLTLTASARAPWSGSLRLGIYDFRGRLLGVQEQPARLTVEKRQIRLTWPVADHGAGVDTYWAEAATVADGKEFGRAATRFYKYEPWSMRNQHQWSTWAGMACARSFAGADGHAADGARGHERAGLPRAQRAVLRGRALGLALLQRRHRHEHLLAGDRIRERRRDRAGAGPRGPPRRGEPRSGRPPPSCSARSARRRASKTAGAPAITGTRPSRRKKPAKRCDGT